MFLLQVSEFLLTHPHLLEDSRTSAGVGGAGFETKLVGPQTKSLIALCSLGDEVAVVDSAGCGTIWSRESFALICSFDIGWRPMACFSVGRNCWTIGQKGLDVRDPTGAQLFARATQPYFCGVTTKSGSQVWLGTDKAVIVFDAESFAEVGKAVVECELLFSMCYVEEQSEVWGAGIDNSIWV